MTLEQRYLDDRRQRSKDAIEHHFREVDRCKRLTIRRTNDRIAAWMKRFEEARA